MAKFRSLYELAEELSVGDKLLWVGEFAMGGTGDTAYPNTVTGIVEGSVWIRVDGEGIHGGEYYFKAYHDGSSEAFYLNPNEETEEYMGRVVVARITDSRDTVPVQRGFDDIREA